MCLSPPGVELGAPKIVILKRQIKFNVGSTLLKIRIVVKNFFKYTCSELNFVQKNQWPHMSISLGITMY